MMKYAANHPWKFRSWRQAYLVGFFQATVLITVEGVNLVILTTNAAILDIIMNFMAIIVITEFDDAFFFIVKDEKLAGLVSDKEMTYTPKGSGPDEQEEVVRTLEDILKIEATSSSGAAMKLPRNKLRPSVAAEDTVVDSTALDPIAVPDANKISKDAPEYIFISERTWDNTIARWVYVCFKIFFASVWFYFVPLFSVALSYQVPYQAG